MRKPAAPHAITVMRTPVSPPSPPAPPSPSQELKKQNPPLPTNTPSRRTLYYPLSASASATEFPLPLARGPALLIRRMIFLNGFRPVVVGVVVGVGGDVGVEEDRDGFFFERERGEKVSEGVCVWEERRGERGETEFCKVPLPAEANYPSAPHPSGNLLPHHPPRHQHQHHHHHHRHHHHHHHHQQ